MKLRAIGIAICTLLLPIFSLAPVSAAATELIYNANVEVANPTDPTLADGWAQGGWGTHTTTFTYATGGHTGTRSLKVQTTAQTSGDAKWYFAPVTVTPGKTYTFSDYYIATAATDLVVQFDNGSDYQYATLASLPVTSMWTQATRTFTVPAGFTHATVFHLLAAVGTLQTDDYSLTAQADIAVALTSPAPNATVSGANVLLGATASGSTPIVGVQFTLNGTAIGTEITTAPYQTSWNTTSVANGSYTLTATARDTAGNIANSSPSTITVYNPLPVGSNLVPNPGHETVDPNNAAAPQFWQSSTWGTNATTFTYLKTGARTGTKAVKVQVTSYTDGDAKWYFAPQAVDAVKFYSFSDYYKSTATSYVVADFTMADGTEQYATLGTLEKATSWTKFEQQFSIPAGARTVTVFHLLKNVGQLTTDDYSLSTYDPVGFDHARISLTFDDGWASIHDNGLPTLQRYGLPSTQYLISGLIDTPDYMTKAGILDFKNAGHEIASHTVTHTDLVTLNANKVKTELTQSQKNLALWAGTPVTNFASPYGSVNVPVVNSIKTLYASHRGVVGGFNSKNYFNAYDIKVQDMTSSTTLSQVQAWINQAKATNTWLVLVYHQIDASPTAGDFNTLPQDFDNQMAVVKNSTVPVLTVHQALAELKTQL